MTAAIAPDLVPSFYKRLQLLDTYFDGAASVCNLGSDSSELARIQNLAIGFMILVTADQPETNRDKTERPSGCCQRTAALSHNALP
eukprot:6472714-Amphidinium_carterae.2